MGSFELLTPAIYKKLRELGFDIDNLSNDMNSNFEELSEQISSSLGKLSALEIQLTKPLVWGEASGKAGEKITLKAGFSIPRDPSEYIFYKWILPDGNSVAGDTLEFTIPSDAKPGDKFKIVCYAVNRLGNLSEPAFIEVTCKDSSENFSNLNSWDVVDYEGKTKEEIEVFWYWTCTKQNVYYYDLTFNFDQAPDNVEIISNDPRLVVKKLDSNKFRISYITPREVGKVPFVLKVQKGNTINYILFNELTFASGYGVVVEGNDDPSTEFNKPIVQSNSFKFLLSSSGLLISYDFKEKKIRKYAIEESDSVELGYGPNVDIDYYTCHGTCKDDGWTLHPDCICSSTTVRSFCSYLDLDGYVEYRAQDTHSQDLVTDSSRLWMETFGNYKYYSDYFRVRGLVLTKTNVNCPSSSSQDCPSSYGILTNASQCFYAVSTPDKNLITFKFPNTAIDTITHYNEVPFMSFSLDKRLAVLIRDVSYTPDDRFVISDLNSGKTYKWKGEGSLPPSNSLNSPYIIFLDDSLRPTDLVPLAKNTFLRKENDTTYKVVELGSRLFELCDSSIEKMWIGGMLVDRSGNILNTHYTGALNDYLLNKKVFGCYFAFKFFKDEYDDYHIRIWIAPDYEPVSKLVYGKDEKVLVSEGTSLINKDKLEYEFERKTYSTDTADETLNEVPEIFEETKEQTVSCSLQGPHEYELIAYSALPKEA